ncbi:MAG TPA: hypothetical protein VGC84_10365 [Ilumatobacteraceae bacterium]|jgi:hypothetical protein
MTAWSASVIDWYSGSSFEPGEIYIDADGEHFLVFAGSMTASAARRLWGIADDLLVVDSPAEPVLVFVRRDDASGGFYSHTKADADIGYCFVAIRDSAVLSRSADVQAADPVVPTRPHHGR